MEYKNDDFLLRFFDRSERVEAVANKYDAYLNALTTADFGHVRDAIRQAVAFFVSDKYPTTRELADYSYEANDIMRRRYETKGKYLEQFRILDRKSVTVDLATGTGKSWVIWGVAQILLAEGLVDKVLVLCPSLTIEEELKAKFERFSGDDTLTKILEELGARYPSPGIKNANVPILDGDVCVENIHAAYERTGSSIQDSFKGKGRRTLVISDEAHHIYSEVDAATKKWYDFLTHPDYGFHFLLGVSGTPYIKDEYFHDVIYRYGLQRAMEDGVVKKINYKVEESSTNKGWSETYANHVAQREKYAGILKPISIVVTDRIVTCVEVWNELVEFLCAKEGLSRADAERKVIWVASGIPSNAREKAVIKDLVPEADKARKANIAALKLVDEPDSEVEWIVSVSMLTEGWDVKNVFQIVPHERKAFNSKLLIAQVLGRGLRIPPGVAQPVYVTINNHESWTKEIQDLYRGVLEIENRIGWGFDPAKRQYAFPLHNLTYAEQMDTVETKEKKADEPDKVVLQPQDEQREEISRYSETGVFRFTVEIRNKVELDQAVREIKLFLKDHDEDLAAKWPASRIRKWVQGNLKARGYSSDWISRDNLGRLKTSFGPLFRATGRPAPRMKLRPDGFTEIAVEQDLPRQWFSESQLRRGHGYVMFDGQSAVSLPPDEKEVFEKFVEDKRNFKQLCEQLERYSGSAAEIAFLNDNLIETVALPGPQNLLYLASKPELGFVRLLMDGHADLFDSVIKSPDRGFYQVPYSYKPTDRGTTHVQRENFNPDFLLKLKGANRLLVVEIKEDGDANRKNQAKHRDASEHFQHLNQSLKSSGIDWTYLFYFLSPDDYSAFFRSVRDANWDWKSQLMQELEGGC